MDKPAPDILLDRFELDHEPEVIGEGRFSTLLKVGGCVKASSFLKKKSIDGRCFGVCL